MMKDADEVGDEIDDLLGNITSPSQAKASKVEAEGQMRDTLGFLKKSEAEKKQREAQRLADEQQAEEDYKTLD